MVSTRLGRDPSFAFFSRPTNDPLALAIAPRLESWDATSARSQVELARYLDHVDALVSPSMSVLSEGAAISLTVGLPDDRDLISGGGDLDNFLYPVVRSIGPARFVTAWASKGRGDSTIAVGPAVPQHAPTGEGWRHCTVVTTASAQTRTFKEQSTAAIPVVATTTGPIETQIAYRLSARRNWAALWKPTIDALGGVLGVPNPARPFTPMDERIVRLALHRTIDESLGWSIAIEICLRTV